MQQANHPLFTYISILLILLIGVPVIYLFITFTPLYLKISGFDTFKDSILQKYSYVEDISYSSNKTNQVNSRFSSSNNNIFCITIKSKDTLSWNEMKEVFLKTKTFLLSDSVKSDLYDYYNKFPFGKRGGRSSYSCEIKFDSNDNQAKIQMLLRGWEYTDYNGNTFEILEKGDLKENSTKSKY